jgi:hypothetical protein
MLPDKGAYFGKAPVGGAKIMPPKGNAVGFIYGQQSNWKVSEQGPKRLTFEPLRRNKKETRLAAPCGILDPLARTRIQVSVKRLRRNPSRAGPPHLICH